MSLNATPSAVRTHIGIFGRTNAGKSSIINALTGQELAIVSDVKGTTTDPVSKAMELLPLGPVVLIDTPGLDDQGELGALRVKKSYEMLRKTEIALVVVDSSMGITDCDREILQKIQALKIPYLLVYNKCDIQMPAKDEYPEGVPEEQIVLASSRSGLHITELKEKIAALAPKETKEKRVVGDLLQPQDLVVLVVPIDESAPKGRLILPQQQTIRDILEAGAVSIVCREHELESLLPRFREKPRLVITDSQVFGYVSKVLPKDIPLTSFSILFARLKGNLSLAVEGARVIDELQDGDTILISEGCTHHRQCEDIGTVKIPRWLQAHTNKQLNYEFTSGGTFPEDLSKYRLVIHCGGCTLNEKEMQHRLQVASSAKVPITNYGIAIAHMQGILERSLKGCGY
jgi:[FeFe] hydrogenase H-cluster maturation GTPase HydF